jgi:hypothetical protein
LFPVVVWHDQANHAVESLAKAKGSATWDALDGRPVRQFAVTAPAAGLM